MDFTSCGSSVRIHDGATQSQKGPAIVNLKIMLKPSASPWGKPKWPYIIEELAIYSQIVDSGYFHRLSATQIDWPANKS